MNGHNESILVCIVLILALSGLIVGFGVDYDSKTYPEYTVEQTNAEPTMSFEEDLTIEEQNWVYERLSGTVSDEKAYHLDLHSN